LAAAAAAPEESAAAFLQTPTTGGGTRTASSSGGTAGSFSFGASFFTSSFSSLSSSSLSSSTTTAGWGGGGGGGGGLDRRGGGSRRRRQRRNRAPCYVASGGRVVSITTGADTNHQHLHQRLQKQQLERSTLLVGEENRGDFEQLGDRFAELVFDGEDGDGKFRRNGDEEEEDGDDEGGLSPPVCRVVTRSDSKLPTSRAVLPPELFEKPAHLLRRLDDIYHSVANDQIRSSAYGRNAAKTAAEEEEEDDDDRELVSLTRASLEDAGFKSMSRRDFDLCEALNAGYLLRLSIIPDVSELDPNLAREFFPESFDDEGNPLDEEEVLFDGRVLVFWRGYSQEVSRGRLLLPKLDYLQASVVQRSAAWLRDRLNLFERSVSSRFMSTVRRAKKNAKSLGASMLEQIPNKRVASRLRKQLRVNATIDEEANALIDLISGSSGKLFKLARYGGSKIRFVGSPNPTDALNPFIICEQENCPPSLNARDSYFERLNVEIPGRNVDRDMYDCLNNGGLKCPYDSIASAKFAAKSEAVPPMQLLKRVTISSLIDLFSLEGRRDLFRKFFSKSELVEPTYEEVVVVWRPLPKTEEKEIAIRPPRFVYDFADMFDIEGLPEPPPRPNKEPPRRNHLEMRSFSDVPMANIPGILPKTKLVLRPADAFVFDSVAISSFLAIVGSRLFNNSRLDFLAVVSASLWVLQTFFRYSNKMARYDLLVKNFLTSKITHRNRGALKYVSSEAGSQRAVRASLVHTWLCSLDLDGKPIDRSELLKRGEAEVNEMVRDYKNIPLDIAAGLSDLEALGLATFSPGGTKLTDVVQGPKAVAKALRESWGDIFDGKLRIKSVRG